MTIRSILGLGENVNLILLLITIISSLFALFSFVFPLLKKKGVDTQKLVKASQSGLQAADLLVDGLKGFFPASPSLLVVDKLIGWAERGVQAAEQLYHINNISADQRKEEASKFVYTALKLSKIERSDTVEKMVEACVEAAVFAMPHSTKDNDPTEGYGGEDNPTTAEAVSSL